MKKKLTSALVALLATGMLAGCGSDDATVLKDMKTEKYVTLGEYKGVEISVAQEEVPQEDIDTWVDEAYFSCLSAEYGGVTDRAVAEGDTVSIDYEGKLDGVAFDGGTAAGQSLTIGSGQFIDGFEEGLVGVMPGETVDLNLTFPENYTADLAGKAVVFTVTVNFIVPEEMSDDVIVNLGMEDVSTVDDLYAFAETYLAAYAEQTYATNVQNAVINNFMQTCVFDKVPEALVEKYAKVLNDSITLGAANYGMDVDTYTYYFYGGTSMESYVASYSENAAKQYIAFQAVANAENLNISDEELDTKLLQFAQEAGYTTIEEFIGDTSKEEYREYFMYENVLNYLVENANNTAVAE